jgi:hypothetical protein
VEVLELLEVVVEVQEVTVQQDMDQVHLEEQH